MKIFLISFVLISNVWSQEKRYEVHSPVQLSEIYTSGEYLVYDCEKRFFACVDELNFIDCQERRSFAIKQRYLALPCAPLKRFEHHQVCVRKQYEKIYEAHSKEFCYSPNSVLRD